MKHRSMFRRLLALALCAALLLPAASALNAGLPPAPGSTPTTCRTWGTVTRTAEGPLLLTNDTGGEGTYDRLILHTGADTLVVDAVTGEPLTLDAVRDGDTVCVNVDTRMLLSEPAQTHAYLILVNLPEDAEAPGYYQVTDFDMTSTLAMENNAITVEVHTDFGLILWFYLTDALDGTGARRLILKEESAVDIAPLRTKNIVSVTDLTPGTRFLLWTDSTGKPTRIRTLPNAHRGWLTVMPAFDSAMLSGTTPVEAKKDADGRLMLPLRALCETLGLTVSWNAADNTIAVSDGGAAVFTCTIGKDEAHKNGAMAYLQTVTRAENGVTWLRAFDLAWLLDLYLVEK